ncbi:hypothetical protein INR49_002877 [Caranx melampygus]|nr:hypothetical protein INR49_002877 [Caranx melampygus]
MNTQQLPSKDRVTSSTTRVSAGIRGRDRPTYLSCSPVTSTSASRSSSAAFFCMVFPMPSISLLTQEAHTRGGVVTEQPHIHKGITLKETPMLHSIIAKGCRLHAQTQGKETNGLKNKGTHASTRTIESGNDAMRRREQKRREIRGRQATDMSSDRACDNQKMVLHNLPQFTNASRDPSSLSPQLWMASVCIERLCCSRPGGRLRKQNTRCRHRAVTLQSWDKTHEVVIRGVLKQRREQRERMCDTARLRSGGRLNPNSCSSDTTEPA